MFFIYFFRLLTDQKVTNMTELQSAIKTLHQIGPQIVAVSSTELDDKLTAIVSAVKGWSYIQDNF